MILYYVKTMEEQLSKKQRKRLARMEKKQAIREVNMRRRSFRSIFIWSLVILIILAIVWGLVLVVKNSESSPSLSLGDMQIEQDDWVFGPEEGSLELIEFSDFQCPACGSYFPILNQIKKEYSDDLKFVYRHFPLRQAHPHAQMAAQASEAAGLQGKFWEMHDKLFQTQTSWSALPKVKSTFIEFAGELGLDKEKFETDIDSKEVKEAVDKDYNLAISSGLNSTPSFILNGSYINSPRSLEEFRAILEAASLAKENANSKE